ncbi:MAG: hypothetical protein LBC97_00110 [Bifidobacteriaceae bacterium]|jgi:hypothetical protein|nr:hypothetical protein [Bifidobacteriaceae bacterium]
MVSPALLDELRRLSDADLDELSIRLEALRRSRRAPGVSGGPPDLRIDPETGLPSVALGRPVSAAEVRAFLDQDDGW